MPMKQADSKKAAAKAAKLSKGVVHLAILVDESGSMQYRQEAVVTGVNEFIHSFRESKGKVTATLSFFDEHPGEPRVRLKYVDKPIAKIKDLTVEDYTPRGMTPLNDAVLETIAAMDKRIAKKERAFIVIITDGQENASESSAEAVQKAIASREADGWAFMYLGTGEASHAAAAGLGIRKKGSSLLFAGSAQGTGTAFAAAGRTASSYAVAASPDAFDKTRGLVADKIGGQLAEDGAEALDAAYDEAEAEVADE